MKKLFAIAALLLLPPLRPAAAQPLIWQTSYGIVNLNLTTTEEGLGYDAINKKAIAAASIPVYTTPKNILALQLGVDGAWPAGNAPLVEPYVAAGHDVLHDILQGTPYAPFLSSAHLNVFGRWDTTNGKPGVGASFSWAPGGTPQVTEPPAPAATVSQASLLNYFHPSALPGPRA